MKSYEEGVSFSQARPFSSGVWIAILIWIVISSICVIYIDYQSAMSITKEKFVFTDSLFRQFESCTNQCKEKSIFCLKRIFFSTKYFFRWRPHSPSQCISPNNNYLTIIVYNSHVFLFCCCAVFFIRANNHATF